MIVNDMVLGYLVNEPWLRELAKSLKIIGKPNPALLALYPESVHRQLVQANEFEAACSVGSRLCEKLGIPELEMSPVWISNSKSCLCWSLPYSMHSTERSDKDTARLEYFKEAVGAKGEPIWWPSTNGDVPPIMRKVSKPRADYWAMSIDSLPEWEGGDAPNFGMYHLYLHVLFLTFLLFFIIRETSWCFTSPR